MGPKHQRIMTVCLLHLLCSGNISEKRTVGVCVSGPKQKLAQGYCLWNLRPSVQKHADKLTNKFWHC